MKTIEELKTELEGMSIESLKHVASVWVYDMSIPHEQLAERIKVLVNCVEELIREEEQGRIIEGIKKLLISYVELNNKSRDKLWQGAQSALYRVLLDLEVKEKDALTLSAPSSNVWDSVQNGDRDILEINRNTGEVIYLEEQPSPEKEIVLEKEVKEYLHELCEENSIIQETKRTINMLCFVIDELTAIDETLRLDSSTIYNPFKLRKAENHAIRTTLHKFNVPFLESDLRPEGDEQKNAIIELLKKK